MCGVERSVFFVVFANFVFSLTDKFYTDLRESENNWTKMDFHIFHFREVYILIKNEQGLTTAHGGVESIFGEINSVSCERDERE